MKNLTNYYIPLKKENWKKQRDIPYIFDIKSMHQYPPHIGVFGGSGSGKFFGLRVCLEELMDLNIPTIVLDPPFWNGL